MPKISLVSGIFLTLCLPACKPKAEPLLPVQVQQPERLGKYWEVSDFELVNEKGEPFSLSMMKGKVWVVDFFYSSCPGPCPALTSRLSEVHQEFSGDARVGFLSVSSDPEKDTPEVLRAYATKFKADDRWHFLTGPKGRVYDLANNGFKLSLKEVPDAPEPISHSTRLALVDREGWVRGFYEGVGEESSSAGRRLKEDIEALLR